MRTALLDWRTLIKKVGATLTPVQRMVRDIPNQIIYTDECKLGSSGVIKLGLENIPFWVWQYQWTMDIQQALLTEENPTGTLTINDLDLAGMVLCWMVLEYVWHNLVFKHVVLFYVNISAVAWAYRGSTHTSLPPGRLMRLLSIRQQSRQKSSLAPRQIAWKYNAMVDIPSRDFKQGKLFHAQLTLKLTLTFILFYHRQIHG